MGNKNKTKIFKLDIHLARSLLYTNVLSEYERVGKCIYLASVVTRMLRILWTETRTMSQFSKNLGIHKRLTAYAISKFCNSLHTSYVIGRQLRKIISNEKLKDKGLK